MVVAVVVVCLVLAAGFGGFVERCEIGVRPEDLPPEASLAVDFDGDADFFSDVCLPFAELGRSVLVAEVPRFRLAVISAFSPSLALSDKSVSPFTLVTVERTTIHKMSREVSFKFQPQQTFPVELNRCTQFDMNEKFACSPFSTLNWDIISQQR